MPEELSDFPGTGGIADYFLLTHPPLTTPIRPDPILANFNCQEKIYKKNQTPSFPV